MRVYPPADADQRRGSFAARRVGVPGLDERFSDVAETFNKQQEHYETMKSKLQTLASRYHCPLNDSLSECLRKIKEKHGKMFTHESRPAEGTVCTRDIQAKPFTYNGVHLGLI